MVNLVSMREKKLGRPHFYYSAAFSTRCKVSVVNFGDPARTALQ